MTEIEKLGFVTYKEPSSYALVVKESEKGFNPEKKNAPSYWEGSEWKFKELYNLLIQNGFSTSDQPRNRPLRGHMYVFTKLGTGKFTTYVRGSKMAGILKNFLGVTSGRFLSLEYEPENYDWEVASQMREGMPGMVWPELKPAS